MSVVSLLKITFLLRYVHVSFVGQNTYLVRFSLRWQAFLNEDPLLFGLKGGCRTVYLRTGHGEKHFKDLEQNKIKPNIITDNFLKAAKLILKKKLKDYSRYSRYL